LTKPSKQTFYISKMASSITHKREKTLTDKMREAAETYSYLRVPTAAKGKSKAGPLVLSGARNKWETKGEKNFIYQPTLRMAGTRDELMAWLQNPGGGQQSASNANNYIQNSFTWDNHNRSDVQIMINSTRSSVKEAYEAELAALKSFRAQQHERAALAPKVDLNDLAVLLQSMSMNTNVAGQQAANAATPKKSRTTDIGSKFASMAADKVLDVTGFNANGTGARTIPRPAASSSKSSLDPTGRHPQLSRAVFDFNKDRTPAVQFLMAMGYPSNDAIQYLNTVAPQTVIPMVGGGMQFNHPPQPLHHASPPRAASPHRSSTSPSRGSTNPPLPTLPGMPGLPGLQGGVGRMPGLPGLPGTIGTSPMRVSPLPGLPGTSPMRMANLSGLPTLSM
jgi:hypothetical protein